MAKKTSKTLKTAGLNTTHKILIGVGAVFLLLVLWTVSAYNGLISLQATTDEQWANVETQYQRRVDLVPNLVSTVRGYAAHESQLFTQIAQLRSQWQTAGTVGAKMQAAQAIDSALGRLIAVAENYPQLKANENFLSLQDELAGTENRISVSRTRYNEAVKNYNTATRKVPTNVIAGLFGFAQKQSFEAQAGAQKAPEVKF